MTNLTVTQTASAFLALELERNRFRMKYTKLHALCYFVYGATSALMDEPLFESPAEAWAQGPIYPELYALHKGTQHLSAGDLPAAQIEKAALIPIEVVYAAYGAVTPGKLAEVLRYEAAYIEARKNDQGQPLGPEEPCRNVLNKRTIARSFAS